MFLLGLVAVTRQDVGLGRGMDGGDDVKDKLNGRADPCSMREWCYP